MSANMGECVMDDGGHREGGIGVTAEAATSQWHKLSPWDWHWWIGKRWTRSEQAWKMTGSVETYRFTTRQHYQTARERAYDTLRDAAGVSEKERIYHDEQIYRGPAERNSIAG